MISIFYQKELYEAWIYDTSILKIGWKMRKLWSFEEFTIANI